MSLIYWYNSYSIISGLIFSLKEGSCKRDWGAIINCCIYCIYTLFKNQESLKLNTAYIIILFCKTSFKVNRSGYRQKW